jgi:hypothetical protein
VELEGGLDPQRCTIRARQRESADTSDALSGSGVCQIGSKPVDAWARVQEPEGRPSMRETDRELPE